MPDIHVLSKCVIVCALAVFFPTGLHAHAYAPTPPAADAHAGMSTLHAALPGIDKDAAPSPTNISAASGLVLCASCGSDHDGLPARAQTRCPVMDLPINKELAVDVRGQRIYVCCQGCVAPVRENADAALEILHERHEYAESLQTMCPVMNAPVNKEMFVEYKGRRIYVCCPPCIDTIQADPARYAAIAAGDDPDAADAPKDGGNAASPTEEATPQATDAAATSGNPDGSASTPVRPQTRCPIMDAPVTPGTSAHVDVRGFRIYICCPPCRADIEADPDAALAAIRVRGEEPEPLPLGAGN